MMMHIIIVFVGLIALFARPIQSWGPVAHYYSACLSQSTTPADCFKTLNGTAPSLNTLRGSDMPDAFIFGSEVFEYETSCPYARHMHDLVFAGYLLQWAKDGPSRELALGYSSHIVTDYVGFNAAGGLLSTGLKVKPGIPINWAIMWPEMQAFDETVLLDVVPAGASSQFPKSTIDSELVNFLQQAAERYNRTIVKTPGAFPVLSRGDISACTSGWHAQQEHIIKFEEFEITSSPEAVRNRSLYFSQNKTPLNYEEHLQQLKNNMRCAAEAHQHWINFVEHDQMTPENANDAVSSLIDKYFADGKCQATKTV